MPDAGILDRAYKSAEGVYESGDTLAIAGTRDARDWVSDALLAIGVDDRLPGSRELAVERAIRKYHPKRIIGHSLGGYVAARHASAAKRVVAYNPGSVLAFPPGKNISIVRNYTDLVSAPLASDPRTTNVVSRGMGVDLLKAHQYKEIAGHRPRLPWGSYNPNVSPHQSSTGRRR